MAPVPRKTPSTRGRLPSSKDVPSGKENARPALRKRSFAADTVETVPKIRVSFASKADRRNDASGRDGSRAELFPAKKTPFHVHHDQQNVPEQTRSAISSTDSVASRHHPRKQPLRGAEGSKIPRKRSAVSTASGSGGGGGSGGSSELPDGKKSLPSKIPRRARSTSVLADKATFRSSTRRSVSAEGRAASASISRSGFAAERRAESRLVEILRRKVSVGRRTRDARASGKQPKGNSSEAAAAASNVEQSDARRAGRCSSGTPIDETGPPIPVKLSAVAAVRRTKLTVAESREVDSRLRGNSRKRDPFPAELYLHVEYHNNLPSVELEREQLCPRLSDSFLEEDINADQRRLVVIFLIRLGIHCPYPSFIVYQAVRLFDAAVDRIRVEMTFIQLTALASLWIVLKKHENFHKIPTATTMVALAKEQYAGREDLLLAYERKILMALNFNVTFADALSLFVYHLINCKRFIEIDDETTTYLNNCGGYLIDLTLLDEEFCRKSASLIAVTAAELALGLLLDNVPAIYPRPRWLFWRGLLFAGAPRATIGFQDEEIDWCRVTMLRRVLNSGKKHCGFEVVYKKYNRTKYGRISESLFELVSEISRVDTFDP